jgi:class 3 adenylate cyclase/tetratricopeptide (TPR) repeat protein
MHRLIPQFIHERYRDDVDSGSFDACALFVDISGFTAMSDALMGQGQHGAEVLAQIILDVFDPLIRNVFEQGGFVTNLAGDAFTAVFPTDGESDDGITRSFAAAWQIRQLVARATRRETPYGVFVVSVKVGLATGNVTWGILSSPDKLRSAYYFRGTAIEGCVGAEQLAQAGELVLDWAAFEAVRSLATAQPSGEHARVASVTGTLPGPLPFDLGPIDPDIMHRFFPREASQRGLGGEMRHVVSMFVNIPTVRTEVQLDGFMQNVFILQDRYGGMLNRLDFGDKGASLLLFWGAPVARENDLLRALNFGLDLQSQTVIPVKIGITLGIAHTGYSGGSLAGEYTCHGRGITLAARLMQAAPRGEIWVDEQVATRAENQFELEFEDDMLFKGFGQELKVFVLLERKETTQPLYQTSLVGRKAELGRLAKFVEPVWRGHYAGALVIQGEPGIGKSHLVHAFLAQLESAADGEYAAFLCQADEIVRESLNPFRYWLKEYFGQSEQQSEARNKRSFNRRLERLIRSSREPHLTAELDRTRSFLGALVNLEWPDSLYEQLDAQGRYENSFVALLSLLSAESAKRPVLIILEDAHLLDQDSKAFLKRLNADISTMQNRPIAVLATARPEASGTPLGQGVAYEGVDLQQMSAEDLTQFARAQLGADLADDLHRLLLDRSAGNPFFAEQILKYLQERNHLLARDGKMTLKGVGLSALPADVRSLLVARLDQLRHDIKETVQTASVLGREFEVRLLEHMLKDGAAVREKVLLAEQAAIWSAVTEMRYLFTHALLRDAAYRMQVRSKRTSLHALAVEALEQLHHAEPSAHYGELAYHAEEAGLNDKARFYLEQAGMVAEGKYQNSLALDYYDRALSLSPEDDLTGRFQLLANKERIYHLNGLREEQWYVLRELTKLAELMGDERSEVEVLTRKAWFHSWRSNYQSAIESAIQATDLAEATGEPDLAGSAYYAKTWSLLQQGEADDAYQEAVRALAVAQRTGKRREEGNILNVLGMILGSQGDYYSNRQYLRQFLQIAREIKDLEREATALINLGVANVSLGDYAAAEDNFCQGLELGQTMGNQVILGMADVNRSWLASARGDWEAALRHGEPGVAHKRAIGQGDAEAEGLIWLGHAWLGLGELDKAMAAYERSLRLRRELGQEHFAMGILAGMARLALAREELAVAKSLADEIVSYLDGGGSLVGTWEPLRIRWTCYKVYDHVQDGRAGELLMTASRELQQMAEFIPDDESRQKFLENISWNRNIVAAAEKWE